MKIITMPAILKIWKSYLYTIWPMLTFGIFGIFKGLDSNYDLLDYHLANGWSFSRKIPSDWFLTGVSSYHPKWFDFLYFQSIKQFGTSFHGFLWGALGGIGVVSMLSISKRFVTFSNFEKIGLVTLSLLNPLVQSEIGTSLLDLTVASLLLLGFSLGISNRQKLFGFLFGIFLITLGMLSKLSMFPFAIALYIVIFYINRNSFARLRTGVLVIILTFLVCGRVYLKSWIETGTPNILVDFKGIFHPIVSWPDIRFRPHGLMEILQYLFSPGGIAGKNIELSYFDILTPFFLLTLMLTAPLLLKSKHTLLFGLEIAFFLGYLFQTIFSGNIRYSVLFILILPFLVLINIKILILDKSRQMIIGILIGCVVLQMIPLNTMFIPKIGFKTTNRVLDWGHAQSWHIPKSPITTDSKAVILTIDPTTSQFAALWDLPVSQIEWRGAYQYVTDNKVLLSRLHRTLHEYRHETIYGLVENPSITNASERFKILNLSVVNCTNIQSPFHNFWAESWQICKMRLKDA